MAAVQAGGDRQELHERIRRHSLAAAEQVKQHGKPNDLLQRLQGDPAFAALKLDWEKLMNPSQFTGRATQQTEDFVRSVVDPIRSRYPVEVGESIELKV